MKKNLTLSIILLSILILNIFIIPILAQEAPGLPDTTIPGLSGDIDDSTGLPSEFSKFKEIGDELSEEESRKEYLKQEQTKILANNKVLGPVLFYTNKFFSFFDFLWKYTFGMEFSWSWAFFFSLFFWIVLILLIYSPAKSFFNWNPIFPLIASIIIASIAGSTGVISKAVDLLTTILTNLWLVLISIIIVAVIMYVYYKYLGDLGKDLKKDAKNEDVKRAQEKIITAGKVAGKTLEK